MFLAGGRIACGVGLDQVRKIVLQVAEHRGGRVVRIGDEAEIDDFFGFLITDKFGKRRGMGSFVKEMPSKFGRREGCGCLVHRLFVAPAIRAYKRWMFCAESHCNPPGFFSWTDSV